MLLLVLGNALIYDFQSLLKHKVANESIDTVYVLPDDLIRQKNGYFRVCKHTTYLSIFTKISVLVNVNKKPTGAKKMM